MVALGALMMHGYAIAHATRIIDAESGMHICRLNIFKDSSTIHEMYTITLMYNRHRTVCEHPTSAEENHEAFADTRTVRSRGHG